MRNRLYHPAVLLSTVLVCGLQAAAGAPALAQAVAPSPDREAELDRIRARIAVLESELGELDARRDGLAGELDRTGLELELQARRVDEARAERTLAEAALRASEERTTVLAARLAESEAFLRHRLVDLYQIGRVGPLRLLLALGSEEGLLPGIRILRFLARREAGAIESYRTRRAALDAERVELARRQRLVAELLAREAARRDQLRATERRQRRRLDELEQTRGRLDAETAALVDKERRLAHLLDVLYGRTPESLAGTPLQEFRGVLDWPLEGRVSIGFGPRLDPRYRTRVPHNGVRIEPSTDAEVRVVFPGEVVFAAPFEGYGPTVVVHHPRRVFTIYAGLRELRVEVGDMVSLGRVLGPAEESLYFEIRVENEPRNPLDWLR